MVEYKDRLALAMSLAKVSEHQLAGALSLTYQGIKKAMAGGDKGTSAMSALNNARAAAFLQVDPNWLATGLGEPRSERIWPFAQLTAEQWFSIPLSLREAAERMLLSSIPPNAAESAPDKATELARSEELLHRLTPEQQEQNTNALLAWKAQSSRAQKRSNTEKKSPIVGTPGDGDATGIRSKRGAAAPRPTLASARK